MKRIGAPVVVRGYVQESAANTYTEREVSMPLGYPVDEKARAFELCKVYADTEYVDANPGAVTQYRITQHNQAAILEIAHQDVIWGQSLIAREDAAGSWMDRQVEMVDFTCDGQGVLIARPRVWAQVLGVSNTAAKNLFFQMLGFIVELTPEEFLNLKAHDRLGHPIKAGGS